MDIQKMMDAAGLTGCGPNCTRRDRFIASLTEEQSMDFGHLLLQRAKQQLAELKQAYLGEALSEDGPDDRQANFGFGPLTMADILGWSAGGFDTMVAELLMRSQRPKAEPYAGELTPQQLAMIATAEEEDKATLEANLRDTIANGADGNPNKVKLVTFAKRGFVAFVIPEELPGEQETPATASDDTATEGLDAQDGPGYGQT